jgi:RNA polymerase sigma-32 factor
MVEIASTSRQNTDLDYYIAKASKYQLLSHKEEMALAYQWRNSQDMDAVDMLVASNLRFVVKVAWEYRHYGFPISDLVQEGNIGLVKAVKKFDPDRGFRLITYAVWWIRAHIHEYLMNNWSLVRIKGGKISKRLFFKLRSTRSKLEQATIDNADLNANLAKQLKAPEVKVSVMERRLTFRDFHMDTPLTCETTTTFADTMVSMNTSPEEIVARNEEQQLVRDAVDELKSNCDDKERSVLDNRLLTDEPQTLREIGECFGVSRERIRQVENKMIAKLRKILRPAIGQIGDFCAGI